MRLVCVFFVMLIVGCKSNIQDMSGKNSQKKGTTADDGSSGAEKDESLAYGNEVKTQKVADGSVDQEAESDAADGDDQDGEQAITPEAIAGAFLACDFAPDVPSPTEVIYACLVRNDEGRIPMAGIKQTWRLATTGGATVETKDYPIDETADQAWLVTRVLSEAGFVAELTLVDAVGTTHVIKTKCACTATSAPI